MAHEKSWKVQIGAGPLIATAIHDGHSLSPEIAELMALPDEVRLREEDPFTSAFTTIAPTRIVVERSRFQVDLNRPRELCIYRTPEQSWGLKVYEHPPSDQLIARCLEEHDAFYAMLREVCDAKRAEHGSFVVLDLHSYNHRRDGADQPPAEPATNPAINVGTGSFPPGRSRLPIDRFIEALRAERVLGAALDVRENVKFRGGFLSHWVHETYPEHGSALAIEVKKFFMDEWSGTPDWAIVAELRAALGRAALAVEEALRA